MNKFKKGDICKVTMLDMSQYEQSMYAIKTGCIAVIEDYREDYGRISYKIKDYFPQGVEFPFIKSYWLPERFLQPLQGSELEEFLKEYPQYRKEEEKYPHLKKCQFEDGNEAMTASGTTKHQWHMLYTESGICPFCKMHAVQDKTKTFATVTYDKKINLLSGKEVFDAPTDIMNVKAGDSIFRINGDIVFVIGVECDGKYLLIEKSELKAGGWKVLPRKRIATVTINGKTSRYDTQALSRALEGLEELE